MKMSITFSEYCAYNDGHLVSKSFNLDDYVGPGGLAAARTEWLRELTEKTGYPCEEYLVTGSQGIPPQYVGTWDLSPDFWTWRD